MKIKWISSLVRPNACLKIIGSMICIVTRLSSNVRDPKTIIVADAVESEAEVPGEDTGGPTLRFLSFLHI